MKNQSIKTNAFIAATILSGSALLLSGISLWQSTDMPRFLCYLLFALFASGLKVNLPGVKGTMSVIFLFVLLGTVELSYSETLVMACAGILIQCLWKPKAQPKLVQVVFNVASYAIAVTATYSVYHSTAARVYVHNVPVMLLVAACVFFLTNTGSVACVIALSEDKSFRAVWTESYFWSFPCYLVGATIAGLLSLLNQSAGWEASLLVLPVVFWMYRSYRLYLDRLEGEKKHIVEMSSLHMRTIEALALAIEAKDQNTHDHLRRVQVYATEIGKELQLSEDEMKALEAASVLHDIGKLAVPEYIISKPGRLTPEEFDKMKIHPVVGAELLERVKFPYPVVPIVRAHHEKWNGAGYPYGIKGEEIPIGARIISMVDCLDALTSDRSYRRAMSYDDALKYVVSESGKSFDPRVIEVLVRKHKDFEAKVHEAHSDPVKLSTDIKIEKGAAPDAGFESDDKVATTSDAAADVLSPIAAARQESQTLLDLGQILGSSLRLEETLSMLHLRLKDFVPHDSIAVYRCKDNHLAPAFVSGDDRRLFSALKIPVGEGVSGWVAENEKPILNGNPSVEPGYLNDATRFSTLRSMVAVPLIAADGIIGVLSLYHSKENAFNKDHLRMLLAIGPKIANTMNNALKYQIAENSATTDYLTGLPNARSLFQHLDGEISRCRRTQNQLAVFVCDLDNFKKVNDLEGHVTGNLLLKTLASKLKDSCREYDYVARMGGDEFVLVLSGFGQDVLLEKMEKLRQAAKEAGQEVCGINWLSMSVGHALFNRDGSDAEQLIAHADRHMYTDKSRSHGRFDTAVPAVTVNQHAVTVN